jgi:uncharacterized membrane protein YedE/YeeE
MPEYDFQLSGIRLQTALSISVQNLIGHCLSQASPQKWIGMLFNLDVFTALVAGLGMLC